MIVDERYTTYLNSLYPELSPVLKDIQKEALENFVPIIRPETVNLLQLLVRMNRPKRILEVWAAVGFSADEEVLEVAVCRSDELAHICRTFKLKVA